ncbi:PLP-dependent aminotransferase family protein [Bradyrhizobium sp. 2]|nr:PLP-dependent aminotransferase family protein [Bradyrhizobium sp. 2]
MKSRQSWAELYSFSVDRTAEAPVFRQIYLELRSAILSGALRPAAKLPSTRDLAAQLGVSRTAVVSAFEQLLAEGYAFGRKGAGTYVASDLPEPFAAPHGRKTRAVPAAAGAASFHGLGDFVDVTTQNDERPFNLGRTLLDARSAELWRKLTARTLRSFERHHLGYGDPRGLLELRKSVCDYLRAARGVRCEVDQIVITAGTQQAVDIVARVMPGPDKEVWIEDPGYTLTRLTLAASGAKVCAIPVDQHGVNVTEGIRRAPKARAVFITASHQFPTGVPCRWRAASNFSPGPASPAPGSSRTITPANSATAAVPSLRSRAWMRPAVSFTSELSTRRSSPDCGLATPCYHTRWCGISLPRAI